MAAGAPLALSCVRMVSSSLPRENSLANLLAEHGASHSLSASGNPKLDIEEAVIDRTAFDGDRLRPRCYTTRGQSPSYSVSRHVPAIQPGLV